ncbi:hypothetical protein JZU69_06425, partial [bacterium]|nr:hypothetical protein [bacterium]
DSQIKMNGMRLEPQEIVDAMVKVGAEHAAVYPLKNKDGTITLYGFVSPETINKDHMKMELKQEIPAYMIPTEIYLLPAIPHNDSGKTDMKQLELIPPTSFLCLVKTKRVYPRMVKTKRVHPQAC